MNFRDTALKVEQVLRENSTSILTAFGVTGTISTAYLAGKATYTIGYRASTRDENGAPKLTKKEWVKDYWKLYIPAVVSGSLTIGCVVGASRISSRRAAALTAAYSLTEKAYAEYKEKIIETIGDKKEKKVRDEIAADRLAKSPPQPLVMLGTGDVLCCELHTGRYFNSDMETLRRAQNDINAKLMREMEATVSDFYYLIGLPTTSHSSYSGWKSEKMLDLSFSTLLHDGRPCLSFEYNYVTTF
jgi:hypothetical protein